MTLSSYEGFTIGERIMMAKRSNKLQEPEKPVIKKSCKPRLKKDEPPNSPVQDKVKKKKASSKKNVPNSYDRIRHTEPQKGKLVDMDDLIQNSCESSERNVAQQIKKQPVQNSPRTTPSTHVSQVTKSPPAQANEIKSPRSPALERKKGSEIKVLKRLQQRPSETPVGSDLVSLEPPLRSISIPSEATRRAATTTTISRAQALLVKADLHSRFNVPKAQQQHDGLSALASELQKLTEESISVSKTFSEEEGNSGKEDTPPRVNTGGGDASKTEVLQEDVTQTVFTEVSEPNEPRFITPKEVALFEDWRPGALRLDKPPRVDRDHWLVTEMDKQQDRRVAQKLARRKKQVRYLEGVGEDIPQSKDHSQFFADFAIGEDIPGNIEESARGYAEFLYRPGAAWMNLGSTSTSLRSFESPETKARPKSCEAQKTTEEIVLAISSASARREAMRKELAERLRQDLLRKKLVLSQNRSAAKRSQCRCC